ncbi:unnamed protein product [Echinostoma caproni]|uniref:PH domain-containing protein n=1 Tax=Echinostoma caproni TaxID=27848 RepID=A0A183AFF4_9TREM|nr:unnamed protein product [Echinostoma caproni]
MIAAASNTGRDLSDCLRLLNQFSLFASHTLGIPVQSLTQPDQPVTSVEAEADALIPSVDEEQTQGLTGGALRMTKVINMCRCLIRTRHSDSPQIAFWQDRLMETWADLTELIETRWAQLIYAARRHTYLVRCEELQGFIKEKAAQLPHEIGPDFKLICQQISQQNAFEQDVQAIELQVQYINQTAEQLLPLYAGKWTARLTKPRDTLIALMDELCGRMQRRRKRLHEAITLHKWLTTVDEITRWIETCRSDVDHVINPDSDTQFTCTDGSSPWSTESIRNRLTLMLNLCTEINARKQLVQSCLQEGSQLYHTFVQQLEETHEVMESRVTRRPTPIIVIDHQNGQDENDSNWAEHCTSPDSFPSQPPGGDDSQTITPEWEDPNVLETGEPHRRSISRVDSPPGHDGPSWSSTRCSDPKSDQSMALSDEIVDDEVADPVVSGCGLTVVDEEFNTLSPVPSSSASLTLSPTPQATNPAGEVKQHMHELITKWCDLQRFWCETHRRLRFQLCAASFAYEADAAEQWLEIHEADLYLNETGDSIQSTVAFIQRHETLEHNLRMQADRFERLRRPTQMELAEMTMDDSISSEKFASGTSHYGEILDGRLEADTVDSLLRQFGFGEAVDVCNPENTGQTEAISTRSSENGEAQENIDQIIYTENMGDHLARKHEYVAHLTRARDRTWYDLYVLLEARERQILFYRNKSDYDALRPLAHTFHNESGVDLGTNSLQVSVATDYTKRPNVFRIVLQKSGESYLFQAPNEETMHRWVNRLNMWCQSNSSRLPHPASTTIITLSRPLEEYDGPPELIGSASGGEGITDAIDENPLESTNAQYSTSQRGLITPKQMLRWLKRKPSLNIPGARVRSADPSTGIIRSSTTQAIVPHDQPVSSSSCTSGSRSGELKRSGSRRKFGLLSGSQTLPPRFRTSTGAGLSIPKRPSFLCPGRRKSTKRRTASEEQAKLEEDEFRTTSMTPDEDVDFPSPRECGSTDEHEDSEI